MTRCYGTLNVFKKICNMFAALKNTEVCSSKVQYRPFIMKSKEAENKHAVTGKKLKPNKQYELKNHLELTKWEFRHHSQ